jgi:hypothetical protein
LPPEGLAVEEEDLTTTFPFPLSGDSDNDFNVQENVARERANPRMTHPFAPMIVPSNALDSDAFEFCDDNTPSSLP